MEVFRGGEKGGNGTWRLTKELVVSSVNSLVDSINQPREIDGDNNDKRNHSPPIDSTFVSVNTFVLVQHRNM
jgi:hypothetical protein